VTSGQSQKGGQGSQQMQVAGDYIVNVGVTEARAREIARETSREVVQQHTAEAMDLVVERIEKLDTRVVAILGTQDRLSAFADPGFIRTFKKAQEGAAASERESDYDMLAALLAQRAERPRDRPVRAGIERAIEIMDQVDDDALRGLTIVHALSKWIPASPNISQGVTAMENIFADLVDGPLPEGRDWIDHLDILDAVRVNSLTQFKPFDEFYPVQFPGYVAPGVLKDEVPPVVGGSLELLPWDVFVEEHELRPGYVRLKAVAEHTFRETYLNSGMKDVWVDDIVAQGIATFGLGTTDESARVALSSRLRSEPTIGSIAEWWGRLPHHFTMTAVGKALATANAFRLDEPMRLPRDDGTPPAPKVRPDPESAAPDPEGQPS